MLSQYGPPKVPLKWAGNEPERVYCVVRGAYKALEYGRAYPKAGELGGHIRVKLPDGRVRMFPAWTFSSFPPPRLERWKFDEQINDPLCDWIDVSFEFGGTIRWLALVTPTFLARQLPQSGEPYWAQENMLVVTEISTPVVAGCLQYLLEQGNLLAHSRPLEVAASEWFQE